MGYNHIKKGDVFMRHRVIIDCDPGHDDAVALILATRAENIELLGVTVVAGNSTLENTVRNALDILAFADAGDIPVYAGCERPLNKELNNASGEEIHGVNGLGNHSFDLRTRPPEQEHAVDYLIRMLRAAEEKITLVCLGPLTNIAAAFSRAPDCAAHVERFIIMGGAVRVAGNVTPAAEFNFYIDPDAAKCVLESGCGIYLNPLDVTMRALFYEKDIDELEGRDNRLSKLVGELLRLYAENYAKELGFYACPLHDALCIGVLMEPQLVTYEKTRLDVITQGQAAGKSVPDCAAGAEVWYGAKIDAAGFVRLVKEAVLAPRAKS